MISALAAKLIAVGIGFLVAAGGTAWFIHHERDIGAAQCEAAVKAAVDTERERETKINQDWKSWADGAIANADQQKAKMNDIKTQIATASARLGGRICVPASLGDKLRLIDIPGDKADPARRALRAHR